LGAALLTNLPVAVQSTVPTIDGNSRKMVGERPDRVENILLAKVTRPRSVSPCLSSRYGDESWQHSADVSRRRSLSPSQGMEYKKNVESRRADQEMYDGKNNTFNPQICKQSAILYSDTTPAYERLLNKQVLRYDPSLRA